MKLWKLKCLIQAILKLKFFGYDGFQNMFVYQTKFNMLELKIRKGSYYVVDWKSKGLFVSKLLSLNG